MQWHVLSVIWLSVSFTFQPTNLTARRASAQVVDFLDVVLCRVRESEERVRLTKNAPKGT